jgi:hypothetical protein
MAESAVLMADERRTDSARYVPRASDSMALAGNWLSALRRYIAVIFLGNLVWEFAQLPLYTISYQGSLREIVFAAVHCTGGDVLIASTSLLAALVLAGSWRWPHARFYAVSVITVVGGLAYTIFSEWLNTEIRGSWAYSKWMPTLPLIGAGLSPFLQWLVVPTVGLWWARRPLVAVVRQEADVRGKS